MCELFAMSSLFPATVSFSFDTFAQRGGALAKHRHGWGLAYREGKAARLLCEPDPASESPLVQYVQQHPLRSCETISHIRLATQGDVCLANTQPFVRELAGRAHLFAHNGHLEHMAELPLGRYQPIGTTDSEHAFCALLEQLRGLWSEADDVPSLPARTKVVSRFAESLRPRGPANFIYSDADALFVHAHKRTQSPGVIAPPGLHMLERRCTVPTTFEGHGVDVASTDDEQRVVLVASVPLSDEPWQPLETTTLLVIRRGESISW